MTAAHPLRVHLRSTASCAPWCPSLPGDHLPGLDRDPAGDGNLLTFLVGKLGVHHHKGHGSPPAAGFLVDIGYLSDGGEDVPRMDGLQVFKLLLAMQHPTQVHFDVWPPFTVVPVRQGHEEGRRWHYAPDFRLGQVLIGVQWVRVLNGLGELADLARLDTYRHRLPDFANVTFIWHGSLPGVCEPVSLPCCHSERSEESFDCPHDTPRGSRPFAPLRV